MRKPLSSDAPSTVHTPDQAPPDAGSSSAAASWLKRNRSGGNSFCGSWQPVIASRARAGVAAFKDSRLAAAALGVCVPVWLAAKQLATRRRVSGDV